MKLEETLAEKLNRCDIVRICAECSGAANDAKKAELFALAGHTDDRIGYNALWVLTHFSKKDIGWLQAKRNELIDTVLTTPHTGKRRLSLALLEELTVERKDIRADYLDFCLSKINSQEPYGIRALCIKQAFALCRFYPELIAELKNEIELIEFSERSRGILTTKKNVLRKIAKLKL